MNTAKTLFTQDQFNAAFDFAVAWLKEDHGVEIRSALKQAAADQGIEDGDALRMFVILSEEKLGLPRETY
jgi:hypothetical protein